MDYLNEINEIWSMVKNRIQQKLGVTAMNLWFGDIEIQSFSENTLNLTTSTEFKMKIINEKFLGMLEESFESFMGFAINVVVKARNPAVNIEDIRKQIIGESEKQQEAPKKEIKKENTVKLGSTMPTVNFEYTFDNFIVGNSNKFAHAASLAVASDPGNTYNPLFIHGNSGLGKTHLLNAICNEIIKNNIDKRQFLSEEQLKEVLTAHNFKIKK